jgi:nitroimidazol reductase NimA-like FMN-containing flavoprotein (pyridoxamine 5'-phosphate oxidase superfamily)
VWGQAFIDHGYDEGQCNHLYSSVHFSGKVTFIEKPEEKVKAMQCMMRQLEKDPEPMIAKLNAEKLKDALLGRIDIDYLSGKQPEQKK